MNKSKFVKDEILKYTKDCSLKFSQSQLDVIEHTSKIGFGMMGSVDEVRHFQILIKAMGAKRCLEIGCFTGYTTLSIAEVLPEDGLVVTCDITDQTVAKNVWEKSGLDKKIKLEIGSAVETLNRYIENKETFDFAFIDADKENYPTYYEQCLKLVRKGGIIAIDNVLWGGKVLEENKDRSTQVIHDLNMKIKSDQRVDVSMLPIGDGVTFCFVN